MEDITSNKRAGAGRECLLRIADGEDVRMKTREHENDERGVQVGVGGVEGEP